MHLSVRLQICQIQIWCLFVLHIVCTAYLLISSLNEMNMDIWSMLNTHHNTHTNTIMIIIISPLLDSVRSSFLFSTPENPSLTANSSGLPSNSPNQFSFFRMNVFLLWRLSNWYGNRLLSMICFDRMFGDCIDVWNRIEIWICRIVDYCSLS